MNFALKEQFLADAMLIAMVAIVVAMVTKTVAMVTKAFPMVTKIVAYETLWR